MTTRVDVRKFLRGFARLTDGLAPGEKIIVTRRGKTVGEFVKKPSSRGVKMPDFEKLASLPGIDVSVGDELYARIMKGLEN